MDALRLADCRTFLERVQPNICLETGNPPNNLTLRYELASPKEKNVLRPSIPFFLMHEALETVIFIFCWSYFKDCSIPKSNRNKT